jgi:hypothetical protein
MDPALEGAVHSFDWPGERKRAMLVFCVRYGKGRQQADAY